MPITVDYKGKLVLVTGGGRGIGLAITKSLAEAGADLAITYTSKDCTSLASLISTEFSIDCRAFRCDVSKSEEVDKMVEDVQRTFGKEVDMAVCNAGVSLWRPSHLMTDDELLSIFSINTFGPYYVSRSLVRSWLSLPILCTTTSSITVSTDGPSHKLNKHILFVSSISGLVAMSPQAQAAYNGSKAGLTMMGKSLAGEWAEWGIRVNMISPGYVSTDMIANPSDEASKAFVKEWTDRTPIGEFAEAKQVGDMVALLLSERAGGNFMTGSDVVLDGGYTIF